MTCLVVIKELGNERLGVHWAEAPGQSLSHRLTLSGNGILQGDFAGSQDDVKFIQLIVYMWCILVAEPCSWLIRQCTMMLHLWQEPAQVE